MKLEGSLDAFSLPDIFQLLSNTKKSGGLHLRSGSSDGVVFFADGSVTGASADGAKQSLARRLVGSGALDDAALAAAVEKAGASPDLGVGRALLDAGSADAELLSQAATEQAVDAVFDLLRWTAGDFSFELEETNPDDVGVALSADKVVAEANARKETWETVSLVVPSPDVVLTMPVVLPADPEVSRDEWALLALVDGRRPVSELVDLTGCGQYAVVTTLAALVQRGLLEIRREDEHDHIASVQRRQGLLAELEATAAALTAGPGGPESGDGAAGDPVGAAVASSVSGASAAETVATDAVRLGGPHVPESVVPPRPEPFLPKRRADHPEGAPTHSVSASASGRHGSVVGSAAVAPDPASSLVIERDPSVNRSLLLRLIAGVRGL